MLGTGSWLVVLFNGETRSLEPVAGPCQAESGEERSGNGPRGAQLERVEERRLRQRRVRMIDKPRALIRGPAIPALGELQGPALRQFIPDRNARLPSNNANDVGLTSILIFGGKLTALELAQPTAKTVRSHSRNQKQQFSRRRRTKPMFPAVTLATYPFMRHIGHAAFDEVVMLDDAAALPDTCQHPSSAPSTGVCPSWLQ